MVLRPFRPAGPNGPPAGLPNGVSRPSFRPGPGARRAGREVFTREILAAGFKQIEEVKFLKENYFVRFKKVEAAKDQGP